MGDNVGDGDGGFDPITVTVAFIIARSMVIFAKIEEELARIADSVLFLAATLSVLVIDEMRAVDDVKVVFSRIAMILQIMVMDVAMMRATINCRRRPSDEMIERISMSLAETPSRRLATDCLKVFCASSLKSDAFMPLRDVEATTSTTVYVYVGMKVGEAVGRRVGALVPLVVGCRVEGAGVGISVGVAVVGVVVGVAVEGVAVGAAVGAAVVGTAVVGRGVGE